MVWSAIVHFNKDFKPMGQATTFFENSGSRQDRAGKRGQDDGNWQKKMEKCMDAQTWNNVPPRLCLGLLSVSLVLPLSVCFVQAEVLSSDVYRGKSGIEKMDNRVEKEAAVWNQRMRRNWSTGGSAPSDQPCSKGSPCSSITIGQGATANTGVVTVDGPKVKGTVGTKSSVQQSSNMAIGKGATANMGSVSVQGSKIKGAIGNQSDVQQSVNKAIGKGATANMGSVSVQGSNIKGAISNQSGVQQSANKALGKGATANMGSVTVQDSNIKGRVTNQSRVKQSANQAIGGATANVGSITID